MASKIPLPQSLSPCNSQGSKEVMHISSMKVSALQEQKDTAAYGALPFSSFLSPHQSNDTKASSLDQSSKAKLAKVPALNLSKLQPQMAYDNVVTPSSAAFKSPIPCHLSPAPPPSYNKNQSSKIPGVSPSPAHNIGGRQRRSSMVVTSSSGSTAASMVANTAHGHGAKVQLAFGRAVTAPASANKPGPAKHLHAGLSPGSGNRATCQHPTDSISQKPFIFKSTDASMSPGGAGGAGKSLSPACQMRTSMTADASRCASTSKIRAPMESKLKAPQPPMRCMSVDKARCSSDAQGQRKSPAQEAADGTRRRVYASPAGRNRVAEARVPSSNSSKASILAAISELPGVGTIRSASPAARAAAKPASPAAGAKRSASPCAPGNNIISPAKASRLQPRPVFKPSSPNIANTNPRPVHVKPSFSLNLAAVKQAAPAAEITSKPSYSSNLAADKQLVPAAQAPSKPGFSLDLAAVKQPSPIVDAVSQTSHGLNLAAVKQPLPDVEACSHPSLSLNPAAPSPIGGASREPSFSLNLAAVKQQTALVAEAGKAAFSLNPTAAKQPAPGAEAPSRPKFSLNLGAVKQSTSAGEASLDSACSGWEASSVVSQVPKLNLTPVLQQREEEQGTQPVFTVAPEKHPSLNKTSGKQSDPVDHFYYYPKLDAKDERSTMEMIATLPKGKAKEVKKIYSTMVEAKQNCEAIAFRGHRLLDQLNSHMKEQLSKEVATSSLLSKENEELRVQMMEYQAKYEQQQRELHSLKMVLQGVQGLSQAGSLGNLSALFSAIGLGTPIQAPDQDYSAGMSGCEMSASSSGNPEDASYLCEHALRDLEDMSANMTSVQQTVNQMSSRLGGVAGASGLEAWHVGMAQAAAMEESFRLSEGGAEQAGWGSS